MSKARAQAPPQRAAGDFTDQIELKPRKGLFIALMVALALWVVILVVLYLTTVRGKQPTVRPDRPAANPQSNLPADQR